MNHIYLVHSPYGNIANFGEKAARVLRVSKMASKAVTDNSPLPLVYTEPSIDTVLHGHTHTKGWLTRKDGNRTFINVGCMRWNYTPIKLLDVLSKLKEDNL